MKKKYRRAVCFTLNGIIGLILSPLLLMAYIGKWCEELFNFAVQPCGWLCDKFRVYDYDPD